MNDVTQNTPEIILRHFDPADGDHFFDMVNDQEIKNYFEELDAPKEQILHKFSGLNENIYHCQYWGVFKPDGRLVGFVSLKKNKSIGQALAVKNQTAQAQEDEFIILTDDELKEKEWLATVNAPYSVDVVIHRDHRNKRFALAAIKAVIDYAGSAGFKKIYFEVGADNELSQKLINSLGCTSVISAGEHDGHEIFEFTLVPVQLTTAEIVQELALLQNDEDRNRFNFWRQMAGSFPELMFHRTILSELYDAIVAKGVIVKPTDKINGCQYTTDLYEKLVWISLKPRDEQLSIIWSIAHEYGHMCQPQATLMEAKLYTREKYLREANAWDRSEYWLKDRPLYIYNWPSFIKFRNRRLENYLPLR